MKKYQLKTGKELIIRTALPEDAKDFLEHINECGKETDFLGFGKEGIGKTLEEEKAYFKSFTEKNFMIVAIIDNKIIGSCSLKTVEERIRISHRALLGICVSKEFWNLGIATLLIKYIIDKGSKAGLIKIELEVRSDNKKAISLYKKMGFEVEGTIRKATYIDGSYYDNYFMGKFLN